jgi:Secretion system C-terminal sorting domain
MKKNYYSIYLILLLHIAIVKITNAQQVVVNGYFNAADPRDEWIELLVVADNTDMRNWTIRDNNSSQTAWQTAVTFNNISFWNNMRAGTLIIVWNRPVTTGGAAHPIDANKSDGYIEIDATNTTYLAGGSFGTSPTWAGNSLNFAGGGDVIELLNASSTHVHALGHATVAGANWTSLPSPKLNHANTANSGDAIYVCPGAVITDYNGPATGNAFTSKSNTSITFGLPNTCGASATGNITFVDGLREPTITAQSIVPTISIPGDITFSWTAATDPNPSDNTIGYMILRNTSNTFTAPVDGTSYTVGATLGGATVMSEINSSGTVSYTDNSVTAGNCYYYRVYAFRYVADQLTGTAFSASTSRGRAYNQTNFVFVDCLVVLPIELLSFTAVYDNYSSVNIEWQTASETNNDFFTIERSADAIYFEVVEKMIGAGNSTQLLTYKTIDASPLQGTSYYRLKQTDFNGASSYSNIAPITINDQQTNSIEKIYPNPANDQLNILFQQEIDESFHLKLMNSIGEIIFVKTNAVDKTISIDVSTLAKGVYVLLMSSNNYSYSYKLIKN